MNKILWRAGSGLAIVACMLAGGANAASASLPDLVVDSVIAPSTGVTGQPINLSMTLRNQGQAAAAASSLKLYFSLDRVKSADDVLVAVCNMKVLDPGATATCAGPVPLTQSLNPGVYVPIAVANDDGTVAESDGTNNVRVATGVVAVTEGLSITVTKTGAGSGTVRTSDDLLQCGAVCTQSFERRKVTTLAAVASLGSVFAGWTGPCQGLGACAVTLDKATSVSARFEPATTMLHLPWMTQASGYLSRFALVNTSSHAINYSFLLLPRAGGSISLTAEQANGVLPARSQRVVDVSSLVASSTGGAEASVVLTSDATGTELTAIYNLVQPSTGSVSNLDFVNTSDRSSASSSMTLPWLTLDPQYRTQLVLSNLKDVALHATLDVLNPTTAQGRTLQQQLVVPARSQLLVPTSDLVAFTNGQTAGLGLSVDGPSGLVRAAYTGFRTDTGAANAVELPAQSTDGAPTATLVMPWFTIVDGYDSSFVLVNRGEVAASYSVDLYGEAGNVLQKGTLSGSIPARGQIEIPARTLMPSTSGPTRAGAVFQVNGASAQIDGTYQVRSQATGALNQTSLAKPTVRNATTTTLVLPWFSRAPGYISRFALINRGEQPAPYTIEVLPEAGNRAVDAKSSGGVIPARGLLVVSTDTVVTGFDKMPRAAAVLRVQAPDVNIEGLYNIVNPVTGSVSNTLMTHAQEIDATAVSVPLAGQLVGYTDMANKQAVGFVQATDPLGRPLLYSLATAPALGSVVVDAATGQFRYTPGTDGPQNDSFQVQVFNGVSTGLVTVNVRNAPDLLYPMQWHLRNTGAKSFASVAPVAGVDLNVEGAWAMGYSGQGIKLAIVDGGLEVGHPDLAANVDLANSWNYLTQTNDTSPVDLDDSHGTKVAGVAGAVAHNSIGGRGVSPGVRLRGYNYLKSQTWTHFADAFGGSSRSADNDVFNYSAGAVDPSLPSFTTKDQAILDTAASLRGGKGAVILMAAGNEFIDNDDDGNECDEANGVGVSCLDPATDSTKGHAYPIIVGALNASGKKSSYSSAGASLWVVAPGGEYGYDRHVKPGYANEVYQPAIITTTVRGCGKKGTPFNDLDTEAANSYAPLCEYTAKMNGTSAATPAAAGVVALMLQANPRLTVRDVKHILATTSQRVHADHQGVSVTGYLPDGLFELEQGWVKNAAGYWHDTWYGFGAVDATRAVQAARDYGPPLPAVRPTAEYVYRAPTAVTVPRQTRKGFEVVYPVQESAQVVESVSVNFSLLATPGLNCNQIELESPSGTKSILMHASNGFDNTSVDDVRMTSNAFYGEPLNGSWRLRFLDVCKAGIVTQLSSSADQKLTFVAH